MFPGFVQNTWATHSDRVAKPLPCCVSLTVKVHLCFLVMGYFKSGKHLSQPPDNTNYMYISCAFLAYRCIFLFIIPCFSKANDKFWQLKSQSSFHSSVFPSPVSQSRKAPVNNLDREIKPYSLTEREGNFSLDFFYLLLFCTVNMDAIACLNCHHPYNYIWELQFQGIM